MALRTVVAALTDVPESLRGEYELKDGKYVLKLDGEVPGYVKASDLAEANGKVVEFRDNNVKLLKALGVDSIDAGLQRAGLVAGLTPERIAALKDLDPVAAKAALERVAELEKKGVKNSDDVATQIKAALEAALGPVHQELKDEKRARAEAQGRADNALLRQTIADKYLKAGGKPSAIDFIVSEAQKAFRVMDNAVQAQENRFSADKPGSPLGIDEWLSGVTKTFDFAFEPSKGGGAAPGSNGSGAGASHPAGVKVIRGTQQELQRLGANMQYVEGKGLCDEHGTRVVLEVAQSA